jgi:hypothetical protein
LQKRWRAVFCKMAAISEFLLLGGQIFCNSRGFMKEKLTHLL